MTWRTTGFLFAVLALLVAIVLWQQRQPDEETVAPTPAFSSPAPVQLVTNVSSEQINWLSVTDINNGITREFSPDESGIWYQDVPTHTQLITTTMQARISGLSRLNSRRAIPAEANSLSAYGLEAPDYTFTFRASRDDQTIRFRFNVGDRTVTGDAFYVQKDSDDRVFVVVPTNIQNMIDMVERPPFDTGATGSQ